MATMQTPRMLARTHRSALVSTKTVEIVLEQHDRRRAVDPIAVIGGAVSRGVQPPRRFLGRQSLVPLDDRRVVQRSSKLVEQAIGHDRARRLATRQRDGAADNHEVDGLFVDDLTDQHE